MRESSGTIRTRRAGDRRERDALPGPRVIDGSWPAAAPGIRLGPMRRALGLMLFTACGWPEGLPSTVAPGPAPGGADYPELLGPATVPGDTPVDGDGDAG